MNIPKITRRNSYNAVLPNRAARQAIILDILRACGDMTAQEVATELHRRGYTVSDERNFAAPRLTELHEAGKVRPAGKKPCTKTGRTVTVWSAGMETEHMPYVQIPKDLTKVKSKLALNLTKRQIVCFAGAAATGVPFYLLTRGFIGGSVAAVGMILLMLPFFAFAMYEKDGQPLEKILWNIVQTRFVRKRVRPYATQNFYTYLNDEVKKNKEVATIAHTTAKRTRKTATGVAGAGKDQ